MSRETIEKNDLEKSLDFLDAISKAKGKGTQLVQGRQKRRSWPDPTEQDLQEDYEDGLSEDGMDYDHRDEIEGSNASKNKSPEDSEHEMYEGKFISGGKGMKPKNKVAKAVDEDDDDNDNDDDDDSYRERMIAKKKAAMAKKSVVETFEDSLVADEVINKGIEVSPFLSHLTRAFTEALGDFAGTVEKSMEIRQADQDEFNLSLARALNYMNKSLAEHKGRIEEVEGQPLPPKGNMGNVTKSGNAPIEDLTKAQAIEILSKGVEDNKLDPMEVVKLESTGKLGIPAQEFLAKSLA